MNPTTLGLAAYVLITLGIGYWVSRRIYSEEDYLIAGRSFGFPLAVFSVFATWFGAETCVSSSASVHEHGLAGGLEEPFGYAMCVLFMGAVFAVPLWKRKLITLGDLFEQRFSRNTSILAVLLLIPGSLIWAAAQIRAFGQVLDASSGIGVPSGIVLAALIVLVYTSMGGLKADAITDLVQGILLIIGVLLVFIVVLKASGGFVASFQGVDPERLNPLHGFDGDWLSFFEAWTIPVCGSVIAQELISRVLAAKNADVARYGTLLGGGLYLLVGLIPVFLGLVGGGLLGDLEDPEQVVPLLARKYLPPFFYILFAGALISAILSTVDSALLACGGLLSHNVILHLTKGLSSQAKLFCSRLTVVVCGVIATCFALKAGRIYDLVETASSFGTSGIFVIMVMGLFTPLGDSRSAVATLVVGFFTFLIGAYFLDDYPYPFLTSLAASIATYLVVSLIGRKQAFRTG